LHWETKINGNKYTRDILEKGLERFLKDDEKKLWEDHKKEQKEIRKNEIHSEIKGW